MLDAESMRCRSRSSMGHRGDPCPAWQAPPARPGGGGTGRGGAGVWVVPCLVWGVGVWCCWAVRSVGLPCRPGPVAWVGGVAGLGLVAASSREGSVEVPSAVRVRCDADAPDLGALEVSPPVPVRRHQRGVSEVRNVSDVVCSPSSCVSEGHTDDDVHVTRASSRPCGLGAGGTGSSARPWWLLRAS